MEKLKAEEFVDNLLTEEAYNRPSDIVKPDELVMELPKWFDEEKFNRGRKFFKEFCFGLTTAPFMGLIAVLAVPSIVRILVGTRRSNSCYTAYKRYVSTLLHFYSWCESELKPGSESWRSLFTVRSRHLRASIAAKAKGSGNISQRDLAITQFGFCGFSFLKPDAYAIRQLQDGDWDAFNHMWRVFGHMIGLEDRYNICRESTEETIEVCRLILARVFTPCLENPAEYFEHTARMVIDGLWGVDPTLDVDASIWFTKYLAEVPGYVYNEQERRNLQARIKLKLEGKSLDTGVDVSTLMEKPAVEGLPDAPPRLIYYNDYNCLETVPSYKNLTYRSKYKLYMYSLHRYIYRSVLGRWYINANFRFAMFLVRYFPYLSFFRFGVKASLVNMFEESPQDDAKVKLNSEYKDESKMAWYEWLYAIFW